LNASEHSSIPQNRERIYIVAFKNPKYAKRFEFPGKLPQKNNVAEFLDFGTEVAPEYYYGSKTPFFDELKKSITEKGVVYQWRRQYVRANKSGLAPTLTANMGMGGHNVPIILTDHGIRKLTPEECFSLMGYKNFKVPQGVSKSQLYKQAGNSVVVPVIQRIAEQIRKAITEE
jgi:DNA (cytosine-5)-methyltransferase 1